MASSTALIIIQYNENSTSNPITIINTIRFEPNILFVGSLYSQFAIK